MPFDPEDPRLTAYALGELEGDDVAEMDRVLAESADGRRFIEEVRETARLLAESLAAELTPGLSTKQLQAIDFELTPASSPNMAALPSRSWPHWAGYGIAASLLIGFGLSATWIVVGSHNRSDYPTGLAMAKARTAPALATSPTQWGYQAPADGRSDKTRPEFGEKLGEASPRDIPAAVAPIGRADEFAQAPSASAVSQSMPTPNRPADEHHAPVAEIARFGSAGRPATSRAMSLDSGLSMRGTIPAPTSTSEKSLGLNQARGYENQPESRGRIRNGRTNSSAALAGGGRGADQQGKPGSKPGADQAGNPGSDQSGKPGASQQGKPGMAGYGQALPQIMDGAERRSQAVPLQIKEELSKQYSRGDKSRGMVLGRGAGAANGPAEGFGGQGLAKMDGSANRFQNGDQGRTKFRAMAPIDQKIQSGLADTLMRRKSAQPQVDHKEKLGKEVKDSAAKAPATEAKLAVVNAETAPNTYALAPQDKPVQDLEQLAAQEQRPAAVLFAPIAEAEGIGAEGYNDFEDNKFLSAASAPFSTFSIDVDTASYSNIRRFLRDGNRLPPRAAVRLEEMVNYFPYDYKAPDTATPDAPPFAVNVELARCPWNADNRLARIGLKGKIDAKRSVSNLVFLIDVSGSMDEPNKLPYVQASMRMLTEQLGENDRVSIVVYAGAAGLVLDSIGGYDKPRIAEAIDRLKAGGSTAGGAGIDLAYKVAQKNFVNGGVNRVILATDGDFNVGVSDDKALEALAAEKAKTGVFLTVLGFGMGNLKDSKLKGFADKGNGNYAYIDNLPEARKVLVDQIGSTLVTVAKDVKIQVDFNAARVGNYRLIGYENRMLETKDFNNDAKDAGEIGAGHTVTALYELTPPGKELASNDVESRYNKAKVKSKLGDPDSNELFTVKLRYKAPDGDTSKLIEHPVTDPGKDFAQASQDFKFASSVAAFGMILRDNKDKGTATFDGLLEWAESSKGKDHGGYRNEFCELVRKARTLSSQRVK